MVRVERFLKGVCVCVIYTSFRDGMRGGKRVGKKRKKKKKKVGLLGIDELAWVLK